ncbi:Uncharacterised protein [uncultured archaeon]|nr:Uncharacterised protein [uncultured archaeon]
MKNAALTIIILLTLASGASALAIKVDVDRIIDGFRNYATAQPNLTNQPQVFKMDWENSGSVGCLTRYRVVIQNASNKTVAQIWSKQSPLETGEHDDFTAYWYPDAEGEYTAQTYVQLCYIAIEGPEFNFTVLNATKPQPIKQAGLKVQAENTRDEVLLQLNPNYTWGPTAITAIDYPTGWIFEPYETNLTADQPVEVALNYTPVKWVGRNITIVAASLDGLHQASFVYELKPEGLSDEDVFIYVEAGIIVVLALFVLVLMKGRKRRAAESRSVKKK